MEKFVNVWKASQSRNYTMQRFKQVLLTFKFPQPPPHTNTHTHSPTPHPLVLSNIPTVIPLPDPSPPPSLPTAAVGWACSHLGNATRKLPGSSGTAQKLPLPDWFWSFFSACVVVFPFGSGHSHSAPERSEKRERANTLFPSVEGNLRFKWVKQKRCLSPVVALCLLGLLILKEGKGFMDLLQFVQVALNASWAQKAKEWFVCLNWKKMEIQEVFLWIYIPAV